MMRSQKGFSIVEILVVVAILATLAAIGVPAVVSQVAHIRLTRSARDVYTELQAARLKAISKNTKYKVDFTLNDAPTVDTYQLSYYDKAASAWATDAARERKELNPGVDVSSPSSNFAIEFYPNGAATAASICISNAASSDDRMKITVNSATGMVTITTGC